MGSSAGSHAVLPAGSITEQMVSTGSTSGLLAEGQEAKVGAAALAAGVLGTCSTTRETSASPAVGAPAAGVSGLAKAAGSLVSFVA